MDWLHWFMLFVIVLLTLLFLVYRSLTYTWIKIAQDWKKIADHRSIELLEIHIKERLKEKEITNE